MEFTGYATALQRLLRLVFDRMRKANSDEDDIFFLRTEHFQDNTNSMPENISKAFARVEKPLAKQVKLNAKLENEISKCQERVRAFENILGS